MSTTTNEEPQDLDLRILHEIPTMASVLDVGAGMATYHAKFVALQVLGELGHLTLVDGHRPYINDRRSKFGSSHDVDFVVGEASAVLSQFLSGQFDVVLGIDVVEHLYHGRATHLITEMQRVAKKKVVLFIPEGNHPQEKDYFNTGGDYWQTHRSTWYPVQLEILGFNIERWPKFHAGTAGKDEGAMFCVWTP